MVTHFLTEIIGLTSVVIITSIMGFIASAMLINAANTDIRSNLWNTIARGVATVNIILFGALLGFGIYIMWHAVRTERTKRAARHTLSTPPVTANNSYTVSNHFWHDLISDPFLTQSVIKAVTGQ